MGKENGSVTKPQGVTIEGTFDGRRMTTPTGKVLAHFYPKKDFQPEGFSPYMAGCRYSIREGNERLAKAVAQWEGEGLVSVIPVSESGAK